MEVKCIVNQFPLCLFFSTSTDSLSLVAKIKTSNMLNLGVEHGKRGFINNRDWDLELLDLFMLA